MKDTVYEALKALSVIQIVLTMTAAYIGAFVGFNAPLYFVGLVIMPFTSDWDTRPEFQNCLVIVLIIFMSIAAIVVGATCYSVVYKFCRKQNLKKGRELDVEKVGEKLSFIQMALSQIAGYIGIFVGIFAPIFFWAWIIAPLKYNWNIKPDLYMSIGHQKLLLIASLIFLLITATIVGATCSLVVNKLLSKTKSKKEIL
jgi:hypothetical protein